MPPQLRPSVSSSSTGSLALAAYPPVVAIPSEPPVDERVRVVVIVCLLSLIALFCSTTEWQLAKPRLNLAASPPLALVPWAPKPLATPLSSRVAVAARPGLSTYVEPTAAQASCTFSVYVPAILPHFEVPLAPSLPRVPILLALPLTGTVDDTRREALAWAKAADQHGWIVVSPSCHTATGEGRTNNDEEEAGAEAAEAAAASSSLLARCAIVALDSLFADDHFGSLVDPSSVLFTACASTAPMLSRWLHVLLACPNHWTDAAVHWTGTHTLDEAPVPDVLSAVASSSPRLPPYLRPRSFLLSSSVVGTPASHAALRAMGFERATARVLASASRRDDVAAWWNAMRQQAAG
jgi:hypothetical protein